MSKIKLSRDSTDGESISEISEIDHLSGDYSILNKLLEERNLSPIDSYQKFGEKEEGFSEGYVALKDGSRYMMKPSQELPSSSEKEDEKRDFLTEYMVSSLYGRILYDRSPSIGLSNNPQDFNHDLYLRSKFFEDFVNLKKYRESLPKTQELKRIDGFEKVVAASLFLGEVDYHDENLGVSRNRDGELKVVKIDHGRSVWGIFNNESALMRNAIGARSANKYNDIAMNIDKFSEAVNEINQISEEEIKGFILIQSNKLKNAGFKLPPYYYDHYIGSEIIVNKEPSSSVHDIKVNISYSPSNLASAA